MSTIKKNETVKANDNSNVTKLATATAVPSDEEIQLVTAERRKTAARLRDVNAKIGAATKPITEQMKRLRAQLETATKPFVEERDRLRRQLEADTFEVLAAKMAARKTA